MNILQAFFRGVSDLTRSSFLRLLFKAVVITIGIFSILVLGLIIGLVFIDIPYVGTFSYVSGAINKVTLWFNYDIIDWISVFLLFTAFGILGSLVFLLYPLFLTALISYMADDIACDVESAHNYSIGKNGTVRMVIVLYFRLLVTLIGINILALPLYIFASFASPLVYIVINGYIFGKEYFDMVLCRHMNMDTATAYMRHNRGAVLGIGAIFVVLMWIPLINLIAPAILVATVVHYTQNNQPVV